MEGTNTNVLSGQQRMNPHCQFHKVVGVLTKLLGFVAGKTGAVDIFNHQIKKAGFCNLLLFDVNGRMSVVKKLPRSQGQLLTDGTTGQVLQASDIHRITTIIL